SRRPRGDARPADGHAAVRLVDAVGEARVPAEIFEWRDVLGEDLLGGAREPLADDPEARAEAVRADGRARLEAVIRGAVGSNRAAVSDECTAGDRAKTDRGGDFPNHFAPIWTLDWRSSSPRTFGSDVGH